MKYIIFLLIAGKMWGQPIATPFGTFALVDVAYTNTMMPYACWGETLKVSFSFTNNPADLNYEGQYVQLTRANCPPNPGLSLVKNITRADAYKMNKKVVAGDTVYTFDYVPPAPTNTSQCYMEFMLEGTKVTEYIYYCDVSLPEHRLTPQDPVYYDLLGNKVAIEPNKVLIEVMGAYRRKVIVIKP